MKLKILVCFMLIYNHAFSQPLKTFKGDFSHGKAVYTYYIDPYIGEVKSGKFSYTSDDANEIGGRITVSITGTFKDGYRIGTWTYTATYKDALVTENPLVAQNNNTVQTGKLEMTANYMQGYPNGNWKCTENYKVRRFDRNILGQIIFGPFHEGLSYSAKIKWDMGDVLSSEYSSGGRRSTMNKYDIKEVFFVGQTNVFKYGDIEGDRIVHDVYGGQGAWLDIKKHDIQNYQAIVQTIVNLPTKKALKYLTDSGYTYKLSKDSMWYELKYKDEVCFDLPVYSNGANGNHVIWFFAKEKDDDNSIDLNILKGYKFIKDTTDVNANTTRLYENKDFIVNKGRKTNMSDFSHGVLCYKIMSKYNDISQTKQEKSSQDEGTFKVATKIQYEAWKNAHKNEVPPFYGEKFFNFMGGNGTEQSIEIDKNGQTKIVSYPCCGYPEKTDYKGEYHSIIFVEGVGYKILGKDKIASMKDVNTYETGCDINAENTPCITALYNPTTK